MKTQHLIIVIDNDKKIEPKKYCCGIDEKTKEDAISSAKKAYENNYKNFNYESYYFKHENN